MAGAGESYRACDRCHGQKLKCRRTSANAECNRCLKANAVCTTGEFRAGSRRSQVYHNGIASSPPIRRSYESSRPNQIHGYGPHMSSVPEYWLDGPQVHPGQIEASSRTTSRSFDSPPQMFDPSLLLNNVSDDILAWDSLNLQTQMDLSRVPPPMPEFDILQPVQSVMLSKATDAQLEVQHLIEQLSSLNLQLYAHGDAITRATQSSTVGNEFPIDDTFALSQDLASTLAKLSNIFKDRSKGSQGATPPGVMSARALDRSSLLFVFSVYSRLIHVYEKIFGPSNRSTGVPDRGLVECIKFPSLKVGSFHLNSSSNLQIATVAQLADNILTQVSEAIQSMERSSAEAFPESAGFPDQILGDTYLRGAEESLRNRIRNIIAICMEQCMQRS